LNGGSVVNISWCARVQSLGIAFYMRKYKNMEPSRNDNYDLTNTYKFRLRLVRGGHESFKEIKNPETDKLLDNIFANSKILVNT
jgi:hypothetical protein